MRRGVLAFPHAGQRDRGGWHACPRYRIVISGRDDIEMLFGEEIESLDNEACGDAREWSE
ncbi:MAG: hypothetical protein GX216_07265 [Methanomicrobiales archaeon]|nr:hypothetical protein [Methanomicrobiales archaeon]